MARNKYPGVCHCCGAYVPAGYGHFERYHGGWRIKCVKCASGRMVTDNDPCVVRARAAAEAALKEREAVK
jgi:invasion protein IalB